MQLLKFDKKPEKGERQKSTRSGGVVISEGEQVGTRKREISSHLTGPGHVLWSISFIVSKGVSLIKRQPIKGSVACKVTVIRFSGVIIKHVAGERLNHHHTFWHHYYTLQHGKEWWWWGGTQWVGSWETERHGAWREREARKTEREAYRMRWRKPEREQERWHWTLYCSATSWTASEVISQVFCLYFPVCKWKMYTS